MTQRVKRRGQLKTLQMVGAKKPKPISGHRTGRSGEEPATGREGRVRGRGGWPKSEAGARTIPLEAEGARLLRVHRGRQAERKLALGPAWVESGRVFTRADGSSLRPSWIGDRFARLIADAGLPPIRLHDLRHTAATLMLAARIDLKVVQETLGHSALSTTSDVYTSVLPELAHAAADAVTAIVPRGNAGTPGEHPGDRQEVTG